MMKKNIVLGLLLSCLVTGNIFSVAIRNNLKYGVAVITDGSPKVAHICTFDVGNCEVQGKVYRAGVEVPLNQLGVTLYANGVQINPNETKDVGQWTDGSRLTVVYYGNTQLQYSAPSQGYLEFPRDFKLVP